MRKKMAPWLLLIPQILLSFILLIGLGAGILQSFGVIPAFGLTKPSFKYYIEILRDRQTLTAILFSLRIAFSSAALATLLGVLGCALLVRQNKSNSLSRRLVQIPIVVPHVVVALFIVTIFSQNGIMARLAYSIGLIDEQQQFPMLLYDRFGIGIILGYLWKEVPFIIYFVYTLMANIDRRLGEAARNLGASKSQAFLKVILPLCRNTILSGFLIIFVFALGAYELPFLLGATTPQALPVQAYLEYVHPDLHNRPYAMALNGVISLISLICAFIYLKLRKGGKADEKY